MKNYMKNRRIYFLIIVILILSSTLTSCMGSGAAAAAYNWPGLTIENATGKAYLSNGQFLYALDLNDIREQKDEKSGLVISKSPAELWKFPAQAQKNVAFTAPVTLIDAGQLVVGGYNHWLYNLDPATGTQNWVNEDAANRYYAEAGLLDGKIFAPNIDHVLYAVNLTGQTEWTFTSDDAFWSKPADDGQTVFVGGMDHMVYALDPKSGKVLWQTGDLGGALVGNPVLGADGILFVGTLGNKMIAIDTKAGGKVVWELPVNGWIFSAPVLKDAKLYFGDLEGYFYVVDAPTGKIIWQIQPDTSKDRAIVGTPLVLGDTLYFGTKAGNLYAYNAALDTPDPTWDQPVNLKGKIYAPIQAFGDSIVVTLTGTGPNLIGLDETGKELWRFPPAKK